MISAWKVLYKSVATTAESQHSNSSLAFTNQRNWVHHIYIPMPCISSKELFRDVSIVMSQPSSPFPSSFSSFTRFAIGGIIPSPFSTSSNLCSSCSLSLYSCSVAVTLNKSNVCNTGEYKWNIQYLNNDLPRVITVTPSTGISNQKWPCTNKCSPLN